MTGSGKPEARERQLTGTTPTANLIKRYAQDSPEYGLYPPRKQFTAGFTADDYRQHALDGNQLPLPAPLAFRIRVPAMTGPSAKVDLERYLNCTGCELALQGLLFDADRVVEELHIGVGCASIMTPADVESLMTHVQRHFAVAQDAQREISIFAGPLLAEQDAISCLVGAGINRLQLGRLGVAAGGASRGSGLTIDSALALVDKARRAGIRSVGADLYYGFADQTTGEFERFLARACALRLDRIALRDAHAMQAAQGPQAAVYVSRSPAAVRCEMALTAVDALGAEGYRHLGNCHFVLSGDDLAAAKDRARLQYTTLGYSGHGRSDWIGLGAAGVSYVNNCYAANEHAVEDYVSTLEKRRLPVSLGLNLSRDDRIRAHLIQAIMCLDTVTFKNVERKFGIEFSSYFRDQMPALAQLEQDGLIAVGDGEFALTRAGDLMRSRVARAFDLFSV